MMSRSTETIHFITIGEEGYSRSWTYFSHLKSSGYQVEFIQFKPRGLVRQFIALRRIIPKRSVVVVMSPSQYLAPFARIFLSNKIILDAGWSQFEGTAISRGVKGFLYSIALKVYLIDLIASHFSKVILLETERQKKYYSRLLLIRKSKCEVVYTGLDENAFKIDPNYITPPKYEGTNSIVLFRGKYNPEAGMSTLAEATRILENEPITFWIFSPGLPNSFEFSSRTFISREFISKSQISTLQSKCDLTLGQLADHARLRRTIPHKAFESGFLGSPYLTARTGGILELFSENTDVACFEPGSAKDLASKILLLTNDRGILKELSCNIISTYQSTSAQEILCKKFIKIVRERFD